MDQIFKLLITQLFENSNQPNCPQGNIFVSPNRDT